MTWLAVTYWIWYAGVVLLILEDLRRPSAGAPGMVILNQRQVYIAILIWPLIAFVMLLILLVDVAKGWRT